MDARELRVALDQLGLSDGEAARLLYISPTILSKYLLAQRKIPGPVVAAVESWQRCGPPPGARLVTQEAKPEAIKLMRELRDSLSAPAEDTAPQPKRSRKKAE